MRGIEPTAMRRVYRSDNDAIELYIAALRARTGKRVTGADVVRLIIEENKRMKSRIQYLDIDNARLLHEREELRRKCIRLSVASLK